MKIALTYDLMQDYLAQGMRPEDAAEFDKPVTIDALEAALQGLGYEVERVGNIKSLAAALVSGRRWDLAFNIAEGLYGIGREAQVPALLDAYKIPYTFSDPMVLALTLHKGMTKHIVKNCGVPTADFKVIETEDDLSDCRLPFPLFAKPVAEGTGKGISAASKADDPQTLREICLTLLKRYEQPVIVETFLPGREFTVGIVGTGNKARALAVMEVIFKKTAEAHGYSYDNKQNYKEVVDYRLSDGKEAQLCADISLAAWRALGCRDGGRIDLRMDASGTPNFLEVNPLAGLNPEDSDLPIMCRMAGIEYNDLIRMIMDSALERLPGVA